MTKCFLTQKTYPDYSPKHDPVAIQAAIYNVCSHIDFINREQGDLAMQCAHLLFNIMNNNGLAFTEKLEVITRDIKRAEMEAIRRHFEATAFEPDDVCRNGKPIADCDCC